MRLVQVQVSPRIKQQKNTNELNLKVLFTVLTFLSCFSSMVFSSQPVGHKTPWWWTEKLLIVTSQNPPKSGGSEYVSTELCH